MTSDALEPIVVDSVELLPGYYVSPTTGAWKTLPWPTDPVELDALLRSSLGPALIDWAEGRTDEPGLVDHNTGDPWRFTPGQAKWLILWYAVTPAGRWRFRSGMKRGAKGTGKDPFGAALCLVELLARVRFSHFGDDGRPVGVRHRMPLVQIATNSEPQSKDVLRVANAMLSGSARAFYGLDCGETRTALKLTGGRLEVLTASEKSSEGDPSTFILLNESHHMTESSGGHKVAAVARRNVGKSPAALQARLCEMSNAHHQGEDSVAEQTFKAWQEQLAGTAKRQDILYDSIEAPPTTNLYDDASRMAGLRAAYEDAPWADLERLGDEILDPRTTVADSIRYYLNGLAAAEDAWTDPMRFDALARADRVVADREQVAIFADLSKSGDATGVVGCCLSDGHVFTIGVWQRPHGELGKGWLAPRAEVDARIRWALDTYSPQWLGIDPSPAKDDDTESLYWQPMIDGLHRDYRDKIPVWATPGAGGSAVLFDMRLSQRGGVARNVAFTAEAMATVLAIEEDGPAALAAGQPLPLTHDGDPTLRLHVHNAKRRPNQWGTSLGKVTRDSSNRVDLAVCLVGARLGRRLALNSGKVKKRRRTGSGREGLVLA